jgi:membrane protein
VGTALTLWAGMGVTLALQHALNRVWDVPRDRWPGGLAARLRGLLLLAVLGTLTLLSTALSAVGSSGAAPRVVLGLAAVAGSALLNLALFALAYRVLVATPLRWADVLPGAAVAALGWTVLQAGGGFLVGRRIAGASDVYGTFAVVIGLLAWITLGAQITLVGAEVNVVRARRLWPRSLFGGDGDGAETPPGSGRGEGRARPG